VNLHHPLHCVVKALSQVAKFWNLIGARLTQRRATSLASLRDQRPWYLCRIWYRFSSLLNAQSDVLRRVSRSFGAGTGTLALLPCHCWRNRGCCEQWTGQSARTMMQCEVIKRCEVNGSESRRGSASGCKRDFHVTLVSRQALYIMLTNVNTRTPSRVV